MEKCCERKRTADVGEKHFSVPLACYTPMIYAKCKCCVYIVIVPIKYAFLLAYLISVARKYSFLLECCCRCWWLWPLVYMLGIIVLCRRIHLLIYSYYRGKGPWIGAQCA